jgi:hypothetical protein
MAAHLARVSKLSLLNSKTSFLMHFTQILLTDISMHIAPSIGYGCGSTGWKCTRTLNGCVKLALDVHFRTPCVVHHWNLSIISHFVDAYSAGKHSGFKGSEVYLIVCGMPGFSAMETIQHVNSATFASGIMKVQLRFGFCHTIILDKDNKFFGAFKEAVNLLQINRHVLSGGNHNPMLVKQVNWYLNKGLKIMTNSEILSELQWRRFYSCYAWNNTPIPSTDLSQCFVALGREFQFPIDFSANKHFELTSTSSTITS